MIEKISDAPLIFMYCVVLGVGCHGISSEPLISYYALDQIIIKF